MVAPVMVTPPLLVPEPQVDTVVPQSMRIMFGFTEQVKVPALPTMFSIVPLRSTLKEPRLVYVGMAVSGPVLMLKNPKADGNAPARIVPVVLSNRLSLKDVATLPISNCGLLVITNLPLVALMLARSKNATT